MVPSAGKTRLFFCQEEEQVEFGKVPSVSREFNRVMKRVGGGDQGSSGDGR